MGHIRESIEINAPVETCYQAWSDFEHLPQRMNRVRNVFPVGLGVWHWMIQGPFGKPVAWDAKIDLMIPNKVISWHTINDAQVATSGSVNFQKTKNNGTKIDVDMSYFPPGGMLGEWLAWLFYDPSYKVQQSLMQFKEAMEKSQQNNHTFSMAA